MSFSFLNGILACKFQSIYRDTTNLHVVGGEEEARGAYTSRHN